MYYTLQNINFDPLLECGPGLWYQVASLNMNDPLQQCPSAWREYNTSGVRACARPTTSSGSCPGTFYATGRQYSRMCGRTIDYQLGSPDAFNARGHAVTIDSNYVYGVSISHGTPRNHIWTYAAGVSEGDYPPNKIIVHAVTLVILVMYIHHHFLEITITVNQEILPVYSHVIYTQEIDSGMVSSVKVSVAAMENLLHGSVWSYPTQQLMILRYAFAVERGLMMKPWYNCWNYSSSKERYVHVL